MVADLLDVVSSELIAFACFHLSGLHLFPQFSWRSHRDMVCTAHCCEPQPLTRRYQTRHRGLLFLAVSASRVCAHMANQQWVWTLLSLHWISHFGTQVSLFVPGCLASLVETGFFIPFSCLFFLPFYVLLPKSVVCHKKENHRVEHRNRPHKSVVRGDHINHWICDFHPTNILLDKLRFESPIKPNESLLPSLFLSWVLDFDPERDHSLLEDELQTTKKWLIGTWHLLRFNTK